MAPLSSVRPYPRVLWEDVILDDARRAHDKIVGSWEGWGTLFWMAVGVLAARIRIVYAGRKAMMQSEHDVCECCDREGAVE